MDLDEALGFARQTRDSTLITLRSDGLPQSSNVWHRVTDAGTLTVSMTADRAKYVNLRRTPWAALHVNRPDFLRYCVIEAVPSFTDVAGVPDDAACDALVEHYRAVAGDHPDWDEFRRVQVQDRRVLATFAPTRAYGLLAV